MTKVSRSIATDGMPTKAWHLTSFRRLWVASGASMLGQEISEIAMPLLALTTLSASAAQLSALRVAQFLPFLLATLPLGLLVDRHRRHRLSMMVGADIGRFLLVASIPLVVWGGFAHMELLYAVVFCAATLTVLYQVADFALLPSLVPGHLLLDANARIAATQSANEVGGRGLGGIVVQAASAPVAVLVNAFGFLVSALCLRRIVVSPEQPDAVPPTAGARREVGEGLRLTITNRYVRALLGEAATFNLFNEIFALALMLILVRDLDFTPATIGIVLTAGGIGSFLGAWFGSRVTGRFGYGRVLVLTMAFGNSAPLGATLLQRTDHPLPLLCGTFVAMGVGIGIANVHAVSLRQTVVPVSLMGRVNAAYRLISWGAVPLGAAVGGGLATWAGAYAALVVGTAGIASATLWVAWSPVPRLATIESPDLLGDAGSAARRA